MTAAAKRQTLLLFLALLSGSCSAGAAEIRFRQSAVARGSLVLLGDVADVIGTDKAPASARPEHSAAKEVERLRRIELFPAPHATESQVVRSVEIRQLLELHGVPAREHRYAGATSIRIHGRDVAVLSAGSTSPAGLSSAPPAQPGPSTRPLSKTGVSGTGASEPAIIVVTRRNLAAGELIREVDLELTTVARPLANAAVASAIEAVAGRETTRSLAAGQPIDVRALRRPLIVERGKLVQVSARISGVVATTMAMALDDGGHGDVVRLESLETRQKFMAFVTGLHQAEVLASAPSVAVTARPMPVNSDALPTLATPPGLSGATASSNATSERESARR